MPSKAVQRYTPARNGRRPDLQTILKFTKQLVNARQRGRTMSRTPSRSRSTKSMSRSRSRARGGRTPMPRGGGAGGADDAGYSGVRRHFKTNNKFARGFKKLAAPQFLNAVCSGRAVCVSGRQVAHNCLLYTGDLGTNVPGLLTGTDMQDMYSILGLYDPLPGQTVGGATGTGNRTRKMMVRSIKGRVTLKNQTTIPVRVTLYDCVSRRDDQVLRDPTVDWANGLQDEQVEIPSGITSQIGQFTTLPGVKPFQSPRFTQFFKVVKSKSFELHAGSSHVHHISIKPGGMFSAERTSVDSQYKGLTYQLMMVIEGGIVQDATAPGSVTLSRGEVAYVSEVNYCFTAFERSRSAWTQYNSLPAVLDANAQTILEDTDIKAVVDEVGP